jgi:hypothetical protein
MNRVATKNQLGGLEEPFLAATKVNKPRFTDDVFSMLKPEHFIK